MQVIKRNGEGEDVSFDKVTTRIKSAAINPTILAVNPTMIAQKVLGSIIDGIKTSELDELTCTTAISYLTEHPDYGILASRIAISNHHKSTPSTMKEAMMKMWNFKNKKGVNQPAISSKLMNAITSNSQVIEDHIDYQRDYLFDYFGFKTLEKSYMLRDENRTVIERPQHMWMRVALELWTTDDGEFVDADMCWKTYDAMSQKYYTHATPTLFNASTPRPQLSSCFLLAMKDDSVKGIYDTLGDCAQISKYAGGIGLHVHNVRAKGSLIHGTNGVSNGLVPMLRVFNNTALYIDQGGGRRNGSFAVYLEPWHADVEDFIQMKTNTGSEDMKARDLFYGLWIPDLFMERVVSGGDWTLFCPAEAPGLADVCGKEFKELYERYEAEGRGRKTLKAQKLWFEILDSQIETGTPYLLYKDAANLKSNQKNLGVIKSSNLCVAPETPILTDKGYYPISELTDTLVKVWNGDNWSEVEVKQTGTGQELLQVHLSDGSILDCTPYHKFLISDGYGDKINYKQAKRIPAGELEAGMKLLKYDSPLILGDSENDFKYAYTHGFFCGDGTYDGNGTPRVSLYGVKKNLLNEITVRTKNEIEDSAGRINLQLPIDLADKYEVPVNATLKNRLEWLAGYLDADGSIARNGTNESIQACSIHRQFLENIRLLLGTLGVQSKITFMHDTEIRLMPDGQGGKKAWRLLVSPSGLYKLAGLGFNPKRLKFTVRKTQRNAEQFIQVVSVVKTDRIDDTFCFTEQQNNAGVFNGILTGNCTEIIEYSSADETAVCNLASMALPAFVVTEPSHGLKVFDFVKFADTVRLAVRNLDRVIDVNYYPTPETRNSNMRHRPVGLGVQGLADVFAMLGYSWEDPRAAELNKRIFAHMYYAALVESNANAKEKGAYSSFHGSPASKGELQFDMWGIKPVRDGTDDALDWASLKGKIMSDGGLRNSLLVAPMPTASTSQILGYNECIEPFTSNIYTRRTLAGEFILVNKHLIRDLLARGLWSSEMKNRIIGNNGSVQGIPEIPIDVQNLYKTVWEMKQKTLIDMAADRGAYICQSQSLNLFVPDPDYRKLTSMHVYAWQKGLKTGIYYLRTKSAVKAQQFTVEPVQRVAVNVQEEDKECTMCSA
jgi:ribonucleoside-diphosphate reductase alpha chain